MRKGRKRGTKTTVSHPVNLDALPVSATVRPNKLKPLTSFMFQTGLLATSLAGSLLFAPLVHAGPEGGTVIDGDGSVTHVDDLNTHIDQLSQNLLMEFDSFDLSADESVLITQPNASAWFVGNVVGGSPTAIFGNITANGRIALVNASGVIFGETASINAAGVFASALGVNTEDLINGESVDFKAGAGNGGYVINHGLISASLGGAVTLLGESVTNSGVIMATLGQVNLAAGSRAVVNFGSDQLIGIEITEEVLQNNEGLRAAITNTGTIDADGGAVMLTSSVSKSLFDHAINNEGVVKAKTAHMKNGVITLTGSGGGVLNMGSLDASAEKGPGGSVVVQSDSGIQLGTGSSILTGSASGTGGHITVDGESVLVESGAMTDASGALGGGQIVITADSNLVVESGASLSADATRQGNGGGITLAADDVGFAGEASATGGQLDGDGGTVTITARDNLDFTGTVDVSAPRGEAGQLVFNVESVSIEEDDNIRAAALEAVQGDIEINATGRVEIADLISNSLDLGGGLTINVNGTAVTGAEPDSIGFFMSGANDSLKTRGQVTVEVTDGSVNANALIDIAGRIEAQPEPAPLPNEPQNPGNDIALTANQGRIRIRDSAELDVSGDEEAGAITLTATGFDEVNESGTVYFHGAAIATSQEGLGGVVKLLGDRVGLFDEATVDVSGALGGGEILVGGNYQGLGPEINAGKTIVETGVLLSADAVKTGEGGTIIVWADEYARVNGSLSARGGSASGDGGFIETSAKGRIDINAAVDVGAENGQGGDWLIDPSNILIEGTGTASTAIVGTTSFAPDTETATFSVLRPQSIVNAMGTGGTVTVTTVGSDDQGAEQGDIAIQDPINFANTSTGTLNLLAEGDISLDNDDADGSGGSISAGAGALNVTMQADGSITVGENITTNGGAVILSADHGHVVTDNVGSVTVSATIDTNGTGDGAVTITAASGVDLAGGATRSAIDAGTATVSITTATGSIDDADADDTNANILTTGSVTLSATNSGVGIANDVEINGATTLVIAAGAGDLNLENTGNLADLQLAASTTTGTITFVNKGTVVTGAAVSAKSIDISSTQTVTINHTVTASNGAVSVTASGLVTSAGVTSGGGAITLSAADGITIGGDITAGGGQIDINADTDGAVDTTGTFAIGAGTHTVSTTGTASINITADDVVLDASASLATGSGAVALIPSAAPAPLTVGVGSGAGDFSISDAELNQITTTGQITVGSATSGALTVEGVDVGAGNLKLQSGSTIDDANDTGTAAVTAVH